MFILTIFTIIDYTNILFWVKIHLKTQEEIKDLSQGEGDTFACNEDDYYPRRLFDTMASCDFPSWTFSVRAMYETEAIEYRWITLDQIKFWLQENFSSQHKNYLYLQYYATQRVIISLVQMNQNMMEIPNFQKEDVRYVDRRSSCIGFRSIFRCGCYPQAACSRDRGCHQVAAHFFR